MRRLLIIASLAAVTLTPILAEARGGSHSVHGYATKNGTYVAPHRQTNPDKSKLNNWSTKGNTNPYSGKPGTKKP